MAVWQIAASRLAEVAVHIQVSIVTLFPWVCRVVTRSVHERLLIVHPLIQRVAIVRMWISQVEIGASVFVDVCETFVVQMKDILSIHALRFSMNVDTEGLDSHRHRSQEVLPCRRLGAQCCIEVVVFSVPFWSSCGSRCTFPVDVGWFFEG